jgi:hypothetical protein
MFGESINQIVYIRSRSYISGVDGGEALPQGMHIPKIYLL